MYPLISQYLLHVHDFGDHFIALLSMTDRKVMLKLHRSLSLALPSLISWNPSPVYTCGLPKKQHHSIISVLMCSVH